MVQMRRVPGTGRSLRTLSAGRSMGAKLYLHPHTFQVHLVAPLGTQLKNFRVVTRPGSYSCMSTASDLVCFTTSSPKYTIVTFASWFLAYGRSTSVPSLFQASKKQSLS